MKKNLKKAVVLLLALVMALTPVQAFAVEKRYFTFPTPARPGSVWERMIWTQTTR